MNHNLIVQCIGVDKIVPNPQQPRRVFEQAALQELAESIANHGVIQPVTLRRVGGLFELIAGDNPLMVLLIGDHAGSASKLPAMGPHCPRPPGHFLNDSNYCKLPPSRALVSIPIRV